MTDTYLANLLGEHENIILTTRQHWFVVISSILAECLIAIVIIGIVTATLVLWLPLPWIALCYLLLIFPSISLIRDVLIWANHVYIVTNRRVIQVSGVINKNVIDSSLEKVNDVTMEQSFFGRLFDFGNIQIMTASELGINCFKMIGDPVHFKIAMLNAKEKIEHNVGRNLNMDIPQLITQLDMLRQQGVLTEEEFQKKKADLLTKL